MILNVSGRCDIVAFYSKWLVNRIKEGYVDVRNPIYKKNISRIYFKDVDGIVFCTKNPIPILNYLDEIKIPYIFHITLTPYKKDIEPNVYNKSKIIEAIKILSKKIGSDNIYIRYDPILLNDKYTINYHIKAFERLCYLLNGYTKHIIISFVDKYKNVEKNSDVLKLREFSKKDYEIIGTKFYEIASFNDMSIQTCNEEINLTDYGFKCDSCVNKNIAYKLTGKTKFKLWKARRGKNCKCVEMVDIGVYNSCSHFCKYCYANYEEETVIKNCQNHDDNSSLLVGKIEYDDIIKVRK